MEDHIVVPAYLENLGIIGEFLQECAREARLPSRKTWELLLVMDEICSQIIQYMDFDQTMGRIRLSWKPTSESVEVTIEAAGLPFNPLEVNKYNSASEAEEQALGGMGLYLIGKMVDELCYERRGDSNILRVLKYRRNRRRRAGEPAPGRKSRLRHAA
jgi:serine/threonine-protein kinase RsbW